MYVQIPDDLYRQMEQWRLELCDTYALSDMSIEAFISFLLYRSHIDVSILLWHMEEGLDVFKNFRKVNDN